MNNKKLLFMIIGSIILLIISIGLSLALGARIVTIQDVFQGLLGAEVDNFSAIVVRERIPRTVFSLIAGAALGISGILMQSITRNPIADPSILGVNSGASLTVVCGVAFFNISTANEYISFALIGAILSAVLVYSIGSMGYGGATPLKLALSGTATSTALSSLVNVIIMPRGNVMDTFRFWQVGSVSGATWNSINALMPFIVVGILLAFILSPALNILELGDDVATGLGAKPGLIRLLGAIAGVVLCGSTTAIAGPIGFIGIMIPHTMRLILGPDLRMIVPFSAISGGILLTLSDVVGRLIGRPGELEVGIVTAFLGAPIFILITMRSKEKQK